MDRPPNNRSFSVGSLAVPSTWDAFTELRLIEPPSPGLGVPMAMQPDKPSMRASLMIVCEKGAPGDLGGGLKEFLAEFSAYVQQYKEIESGEMLFDDGATGYFSKISFEALPGLLTLQYHVVRPHGEQVVHMTASLAYREKHKLESEIIPLIRSYQPPVD
ncbi:MAG: hypothetical protein JXR83_20190 [Deltaproteobacteria bacterium]|nr:hypothetical protein [Deltaproteobacteria bacterium]